jgi:transposase
MIPMPAGMRIWVACGATEMRRGFDGLAMMVQDVLNCRACETIVQAPLPSFPIERGALAVGSASTSLD